MEYKPTKPSNRCHQCELLRSRSKVQCAHFYSTCRINCNRLSLCVCVWCIFRTKDYRKHLLSPPWRLC